MLLFPLFLRLEEFGPVLLDLFFLLRWGELVHFLDDFGGRFEQFFDLAFEFGVGGEDLSDDGFVNRFSSVADGVLQGVLADQLAELRTRTQFLHFLQDLGEVREEDQERDDEQREHGERD